MKKGGFFVFKEYKTSLVPNPHQSLKFVLELSPGASSSTIDMVAELPETSQISHKMLDSEGPTTSNSVQDHINKDESGFSETPQTTKIFKVHPPTPLKHEREKEFPETSQLPPQMLLSGGPTTFNSIKECVTKYLSGFFKNRCLKRRMCENVETDEEDTIEELLEFGKRMRIDYYAEQVHPLIPLKWRKKKEFSEEFVTYRKTSKVHSRTPLKRQRKKELPESSQISHKMLDSEGPTTSHSVQDHVNKDESGFSETPQTTKIVTVHPPTPLKHEREKEFPETSQIPPKMLLSGGPTTFNSIKECVTKYLSGFFKNRCLKRRMCENVETDEEDTVEELLEFGKRMRIDYYEEQVHPLIPLKWRRKKEFSEEFVTYRKTSKVHSCTPLKRQRKKEFSESSLISHKIVDSEGPTTSNSVQEHINKDLSGFFEKPQTTEICKAHPHTPLKCWRKKEFPEISLISHKMLDSEGPTTSNSVQEHINKGLSGFSEKPQTINISKKHPCTPLKCQRKKEFPKTSLIPHKMLEFEGPTTSSSVQEHVTKDLN